MNPILLLDSPGAPILTGLFALACTTADEVLALKT